MRINLTKQETMRMRRINSIFFHLPLHLSLILTYSTNQYNHKDYQKKGERIGI